MKEEHLPEDWVPPEVPVTLQTLQDAGFTLAVLSNRTNPCHEDLAKLGLDRYFNLALVAGELACWKPDPQIFHRALERLGCNAQQAVYVGDNYYADIIGAHRAGLRPVLLDPDNLFPEAECEIIRTMADLPALLSKPA
jgi:putative hydrolase of the HAD superfamily